LKFFKQGLIYFLKAKSGRKLKIKAQLIWTQFPIAFLLNWKRLSMFISNPWM